MAARLTDAEKFQRKVLAALSKSTPRKMKDIAGRLDMLTTKDGREFVNSNDGAKIRKAIAVLKEQKKASSQGGRSTMVYLKL